MTKEDHLRSLLLECLHHIDLLEGHLPMNNDEDVKLYKDSIMFGEYITKRMDARFI